LTATTVRIVSATRTAVETTTVEAKTVRSGGEGKVAASGTLSQRWEKRCIGSRCEWCVVLQLVVWPQLGVPRQVVVPSAAASWTILNVLCSAWARWTRD